MCNLHFQGYMGLGFQGPKGEKVSLLKTSRDQLSDISYYFV